MKGSLLAPHPDYEESMKRAKIEFLQSSLLEARALLAAFVEMDTFHEVTCNKLFNDHNLRPGCDCGADKLKREASAWLGGTHGR